ncbi:helix-turn-helix domain-containing protein, partial [Kitasatospora sp. DSM 101779]|uniref:helix-turn-helix domain-containing protein n=1 Tax=Kitasatospora sp. DSM 101779 TaxID=2853165 RepID=UPI0021D93E60
MARKPRPVDPADGPVQAFAYDLRVVREQAGNPTYRVLADRAGFGATTLSDAAGGVRFPSLEVTQAYVGACGGDVAEWTKRWHEVDKRLASDAEAPPAAAEPATAAPSAVSATAAPAAAAPVAAEPPATATAPAAAPDAAESGGDSADLALPAPEPGAPVDLAESGPARRWPVGWTTAGTAAVLALTVVLVLVAVRSASSTARQHPDNPTTTTSAVAASAVGCPPPDGTTPALFAGETYNATTRVRAGASLSADVVAQLPTGCRLALTGFCLGDVVVDTTSGSPDIRWFRLATGGYVSSAVVHGNPPAGLRPADCPDGVAPPASVALAAAASAGAPGAVELRATGDHVAIVGYAAYLPRSGSSMPQWQQIGFTSEAATGFKVTWRPGAPAEGSGDGGAPVPMVAVACFGGDGPTAVADARLVARPVPA